jgi:hypothetical protein
MVEKGITQGGIARMNIQLELANSRQAASSWRSCQVRDSRRPDIDLSTED